MARGANRGQVVGDGGWSGVEFRPKYSTGLDNNNNNNLLFVFFKFTKHRING